MTLITHYSLTEDSGGTAYDYSDDNHGTITGAGPAGTGTVTGPFGNSAYSFDGTDDNVTQTHESGLDPKRMTIAFWFKSASDTQGDARMSDKFTTDNKHHIFRHVDHDADGVDELQAYFGDDEVNNGNLILDLREPNVGTWEHVAMTANTNVGICYLNGEEVARGTFTTDGPHSSTADLGLGYDSASNGSYWAGDMADYRMYNRALSPQEVEYLYQSAVQSEVIFE